MITKPAQDGILAAAIVTGKIFDPAATFVRLVTGPPTGDPALGASYPHSTAAAFDPEAITTWGGLQHLLDGRSARSSPAITFTPASSADATTFTGLILGDDSVTTNVREYIEFSEQYSLLDATTPLTVIVRLCIGENASFDSTVVIDG